VCLSPQPCLPSPLENLKDCLSEVLGGVLSRPHGTTRADTLIATITQLVRAMEEGVISTEDTRAVLSSFHIPGFCLDRWVAEMVEEGVYCEDTLAQAA
jgi:hypothetical protein